MFVSIFSYVLQHVFLFLYYFCSCFSEENGHSENSLHSNEKKTIIFLLLEMFYARLSVSF